MVLCRLDLAEEACFTNWNGRHGTSNKIRCSSWVLAKKLVSLKCATDLLSTSFYTLFLVCVDRSTPWYPLANLVVWVEVLPTKGGQVIEVGRSGEKPHYRQVYLFFLRSQFQGRKITLLWKEGLLIVIMSSSWKTAGLCVSKLIITMEYVVMC